MLIELDLNDSEMKTFLERKGYTVTQETYTCNRMHVGRDERDNDSPYYQIDTLTELFAYIGEKPVIVENTFATYLLRVVFKEVIMNQIIYKL